MYIHISKEKTTNLDHLGNKGLFVGYSEQSKYYLIYILGYCQIELRRDVTFDEDTSFIKSNKYKEDEEEHETPRVVEGPKPVRNEEEEQIPEDRDIKEPQRPE